MGDTRNAEATRGRILAAAEAIFAEEGFNGARVDAIAARAQINKQMLYHYFGDKEGLYVAVVRQMLERVANRMNEAFDVAEHEDPVEALHTMLRAYFDTVQTEPNYSKLIIHEAIHGWPAFTAIERGADTMGQDVADQLFGQLSPLIQQGVAAGTLRATLDPRLVIVLATILCRIYILLLPRLQLLWPDEPLDSPERLTWAREQLVELLMHGFATR